MQVERCNWNKYLCKFCFVNGWIVAAAGALQHLLKTKLSAQDAPKIVVTHEFLIEAQYGKAG